MQFIDNWKVSSKIVAALMMLSAAFIFCAAYSSYQLMEISTRYTALTEHQAPATLELTRARLALNQIGYAAYEVLVYDGASKEAAAAKTAFQQAAASARESLDKYTRLQPDNAGEVANLKARFDDVIQASTKAVDFGMQNKNDDAKAVLVGVDRSIQGLNQDVHTINVASETAAEKTSVALARSARDTVLSNIALATAGILVAMGFGLWISKSKISAPLNALAHRMGRLAGGDLDVQVDGQDRRDEVGQMAKAVQVFKEIGLKARETEAEAERIRNEAATERGRNEADRRLVEQEQAMVVQTLAANLGRLAKGDLTAQIETDFTGQYAQIKTDFNGAVSSLLEAMNAITTATGGIRGGSDEIATASDDLSKRTEQQAASLEETAAALDQITATVKRSADGARQASTAASGAKADAERSGAVVGEAVTAMGEIEQSSQKISQIIGVIDEIAFQTNLLALNAGVEAARAGDAGRGFAVVAQEVRALAQRSAEAAKEIKTLIASSSSQVERGVKLVGDTGKALGEIVDKVGQIDLLISEIARSSQEQSTGLNEVNVAVNQMDQVTQQNAAMVEQATAASVSLKNEATELARLVSQFQTGAAIQSGPARSAPVAARVQLAQPGRHSPAGNPVAQVQRRAAAYARGAAPALPAADSDSWEEF